MAASITSIHESSDLPNPDDDEPIHKPIGLQISGESDLITEAPTKEDTTNQSELAMSSGTKFNNPSSQGHGKSSIGGRTSLNTV